MVSIRQSWVKGKKEMENKEPRMLQQNYKRPHGSRASTELKVVGKIFFHIFTSAFSMQTRKWRWHVPQSKGLAFFLFFWSACAMEEALKTAKSSAAAANKYAIFLLSCLSGCQAFAHSPFADCTRLESVSARPAVPDPDPILVAGFELEKQQNGKQKIQTKRWTHINAIWRLCTSPPRLLRSYSYVFFHIFLLIEFQFDCSFLEAMGAMGGNIW